MSYTHATFQSHKYPLTPYTQYNHTPTLILFGLISAIKSSVQTDDGSHAYTLYTRHTLIYTYYPTKKLVKPIKGQSSGRYTKLQVCGGKRFPLSNNWSLYNQLYMRKF